MTVPETPRDSTDTTFRSGFTGGQWLGVIVGVANLGLMFVDAIVLREKVSTQDVVLHGLGFALTGFLLYPQKFLALVDMVKDKIPGLSK